jgi:predicted HNH restriction endonuclease
MFAVSWQRVKDELDKCILLCSNCHAELHDQEILEKYEIK